MASGMHLFKLWKEDKQMKLSKETQDKIWATTPVVTSQYDTDKKKVTNLDSITVK